MTHKPDTMSIGRCDLTSEISDAQHNHNERSAIHKHYTDEIQSIAKALGMEELQVRRYNLIDSHEVVKQAIAIVQERDTLRRLLEREQSQHHEQIRWRACDQRRLAQILGLDPESPANTIPTMMDAVQRLVEDTRSWRQSQRKR